MFTNIFNNAKAYIKGGFMGILTTIVILGMMTFIAVIENM